jgi:hypothetical protein
MEICTVKNADNLFIFFFALGLMLCVWNWKGMLYGALHLLIAKGGTCVT